MRLEQAILDRLEKRNGQIAQLQSTVHALERAADAEREHARQQLAQQKNEIYGLRQLVNEKMAINEQLAEQITTARLEREQMQHQISELRTERDRIREISKSLVPKSALKQAVQEAAELHAEVVKLRAEVPLESTREGLKNAVAKLQEVTADRDRVRNELAAIVAEANKSGRCGGDPVALLKQGQVDRDTAESLDRQLGAALALSNERAQEIRKPMDGHAEDVKAQAELLSKYESLLTKITDLGSYAMTLGRKEGEPLEMFMERQALRLAALESKAGPSIETLSAELSVRYAEIAELHKWATGLIESPAFAHYHYERVQEYNEIVARINSRPQLDLTVTLPTVDWQVVARNLEQTIAGLNAKVAELEAQAGKIGYVAKGEHEEAVTAARENGIHKGESLSGFIWRQCEGLRKSQAENAPLNKLYFTMRKHRDDCNISANAEPIYRAVNEASDAIKQLTA